MIQIRNLTFHYKTRRALQGLDLSIAESEIFGLLGPNGSGKTTLFRILSTYFLSSSGNIRMAGFDLKTQSRDIRKILGVVFQSPSLDGKLTVLENLKHQGHLYGMAGSELENRAMEMLERLGMSDRARDIVEKLSGGLKRRAELAKGLLHRPKILILDEPSTGLDPGARLDLWRYLKQLNQESGMTILVTTHLMEEAEQCGRIAILHEGKVVASGSPEVLKREVGGDVIVLQSQDPADLGGEIEKKFKLKAAVVGSEIHLEHPQGHRFVTDLVEVFPGRIEAVIFRKPTLEDVFVHATGHRFWVDHDKEEA